MTWKTSALLYSALVLAVAALRVRELRISRRHTSDLRTRGAATGADPVYPYMVALHTAVLVGCLAEVWGLARPFLPALGWPMLGAVLAANGLRLWVIRTLGTHWNVRVMASVAPSTGLDPVTAGPYRFVRHPNYVAVYVELLALPLVHGAYVTAVAGALLHALVLRARVRSEELVLLADERYRTVMAAKPRFVPLPGFFRRPSP